MSYTGPFPPPGPDRLYMSNIDFVLKQLTFNWSSISPDCPAIYYNILASSCGSCPTTTNHTTVTCTDVPTSDSACTFALQTVICGNITSNRSVPVRVNTGILYHTQTVSTCDSYMHNSVYIIFISCLATALIISVMFSITVIVIILMRSKERLKLLLKYSQ